MSTFKIGDIVCFKEEFVPEGEVERCAYIVTGAQDNFITIKGSDWAWNEVSFEYADTYRRLN